MDHKQFWIKVRDAAYDGQNGSVAYALDRLRMIHEMAMIALSKLENPARKWDYEGSKVPPDPEHLKRFDELNKAQGK